MFYAEIQDGCQKWQEKDFWKKSPVNSGDTLAIKNFNEIALSCKVYEINAFAFYAEIQDGHQKWRQNDFWEKSPFDSPDTLPGGKKFRPNRCISHRFPDECVFTFYAEIQDGRQKWQENDFGENSPVDSGDTLALKNFNEIALSCTVFEIFTLFYFPLKSKMAAISCKNWIFSLFNKTPLYYPVGQKFTRNRSISYSFGDIYTF